MEVHCPECARPLLPADIDVYKDTALCRHCNKTFEFGDLVETDDNPDAELDWVDLNCPPAGVMVAATGPQLTVTCRPPHRSTGVPLLVIGAILVMGAGAIFLPQGRIEPPLFVFSGFGLCLLFFGILSLKGFDRLHVEGSQVVIFRGVGSLGYRRRMALADPYHIVSGMHLAGDQRLYVAAVLHRAMKEAGLPLVDAFASRAGPPDPKNRR